MALTDNIVAYYKLDESSGNAADSVGSNTLTNSSVTYASAKINNGAVFNGSAKYDSVTGTFPASGNFSMSFWYYGNAASGLIAGDWTIAKRNIFVNMTSNSIALYRGDGGTNQSAAPTTSTTIANNTWTHVVFTQSGTTGTVYLNGVSNATSNLTYTGGASTTNTVNFGYYNNGAPSAYITATLDEIGIWSRELTSTEVTSLYNSGAGLQYPFSGGGSTFSPRMSLLGVGR